MDPTQRFAGNEAFECLVAQGELAERQVALACKAPLAKPDNMTVLTVAPLLAETIMNVFADDSVSAIFGGENQLF